jgi:preprotein translocase subunit SecF
LEARLIDIVGKRKWFFLFSVVIMIPGIVFLLMGGLKLGIDFTGGTIWELQFQREIAAEEVREVLAANGLEAQVQIAENSDGSQRSVALIRTRELKSGSEEEARLETALRERFGDFTELQLQTVGPTVGASISQRALIAVALTSVGILLYLAYAFRQAPHPFRYGVCAILAMIHDVIIVLGVFAFLGYFFNVEIDALFVTALLTIIGFSVHDTIVVFDRIRENVGRRAGVDFADIVNYSTVQTMVRSVNTSMTVVFTLLALYLFGGETIKPFILALLIGIISGTYSSIFNASLLLVVWEKRELAHFFDRFRGRNRPATA